ncbi:MAG TPA: AmmeMemoRadiSam system protein B [Caldilineaceae bacterium]|nr:AmmeMemoRadiSam system protein B [Caldilineaceae bacterium]
MAHERASKVTWVREPAVAGRFYPATPSRLEQAVRSLLEQATGTPEPNVRALIVPHAGYLCSGHVAACAFRRLLDHGRAGPTVYLMGPAHWLPVEGVGLSTAHSFATPLGLAPVAHQRVERLLQMGKPFSVADAAHAPEHCLEVQLPFLQIVLARFQIVPMLFGIEADPALAARALIELVNDESSLLVVSSDLSHGYTHEQAQQMDRNLLAAVLAGDLAAVERGEACGLSAILCLMHMAHHFGWTPSLLGYCTSGDTCSSRASVVGYGALLYRDLIS